MCYVDNEVVFARHSFSIHLPLLCIMFPGNNPVHFLQRSRQYGGIIVYSDLCLHSFL